MAPLSSLTPRSRSHAQRFARTLDPGRYLAVDDGGEVVLLALRPGMTRIGRSPRADIAFDDGSVSRRHAVLIARSDGGADIADDSSLNGTYVNGERIVRCRLHDGDRIEIGRKSLRFVEVAGETALQPTDEVALVA
jgi:pSer/pThr/pTyr-binding forkhead associated (FHA) protein